MRIIPGWILTAALLPSTLCAAILPAEESAGHGAPPAARLHEGVIPYVIVTERRLQGAFTPLVHARTQGGLPAAVVTIEEIEAAFPAGVDLAERIRLFLKDAYANRGTQWVLLGGDASVVPMRRARLWNLMVLNTIDLPTDQYYACLDGTWNSDGDAYWGETLNPLTGEPGDDVDLAPELFVGRAPVRTPAEVADFVQRTRAYESRLASGGPREALLAADVINGFIDGALFTEGLLPALEADPTRGILRLYENTADWPGSSQESRPALLAALDGGPDLAVLVGAGGPGILVAGQEFVDYVTSDDLLGLSNASRYPVVYVLSGLTTDPGPPLSIGAALMQARRGGGAAVIGCSHHQFVGLASFLMELFFNEALGAGSKPIGEALADAIMSHHALYPYDFARPTNQGTLLFGDPTLRLDPSAAPVALGESRRPLEVRAGIASGSATSAIEAHGEAPDPVTLTLARSWGDRAAEQAAPAPTSSHASAAGFASIEVQLAAPWPSPARTSATLGFALPPAAAGARYELGIFDLLGRRVRALADGSAAPGRSEIQWDLRSDAGAAVPDGVYLVRLAFAGGVRTQRLLVLK